MEKLKEKLTEKEKEMQENSINQIIGKMSKISSELKENKKKEMN